jgi:hypothetical protein
MKRLVDFVKLTAIDFKTCWEYYPNVMIWSAVIAVILFFI